MTDLETSQEGSREVVGRLSQPGTAIEQTFIMRRQRLNSLTVWAAKDASSPAANDQSNLPLQVNLYQYPQEVSALYTTTIAVSASGPLYMTFFPQRWPAGQTYLIRLTAPQGGLDILGTDADVYAQGTALVNNRPISADIAFRTTYDYDVSAALKDLVNLLPDLWLVLPVGAVLFLPGWLLLDLSGLADRFDGVEQLALSTGLSLSIIPLLMLWTTTVGLHWNRTVVILVALILAAAGIWRLVKKRFSFHITPIGLSLAGVLLLSLGVRLAMARDLAGPAWVDSVHHALITRLVEVNGGFPPTYAPYVDIPADLYHSGYHSTLAVFQWLSGLELPEAMLLYGNVLNALAVLSTYLLTTTLTRSRPAGLVAALISGLVTPMPAYYTSWGRYTELAGLLIMPAVLAIFVQLNKKEGEKPDVKAILLACLAFTGELLVHYRVLAFLAILLAAYVISQISFSNEKLLSLGKKVLVPISLIALGSLLLAMPWVFPNLSRAVPYVMQSAGSPRGKLFGDFTWSFLNAALGKYSLWAAGLGLLVALIRLQRFTLTVVLWVIGMFSLANLAVFGLPGGSFVNTTSVEISLFMPISLLGGYLVSQVAELAIRFLPGYTKRLTIIVFVAIGFLVAVLGMQQLLPLLNPITELSRQGDRPAMQWIQVNIPQDEIILINPFQWMVGVYAGNDGGYWITPLTGRKTIPPPAIYGFGSSQYIHSINVLSQKIIQDGGNPDDLWNFMQANDLHYIYTGVRGGPISVSGLDASPHFEKLYANQGAYIFKTIP